MLKKPKKALQFGTFTKKPRILYSTKETQSSHNSWKLTAIWKKTRTRAKSKKVNTLFQSRDHFKQIVNVWNDLETILSNSGRKKIEHFRSFLILVFDRKLILSLPRPWKFISSNWTKQNGARNFQTQNLYWKFPIEFLQSNDSNVS